MKPESTQAALNPLLTLKVWGLVAAFETKLAAELSTMGLSVAAFRLIGVLMDEPNGLRQAEVARRLGVRPPTVSAALKRLEKEGIIVRTSDPTDPRARLVRLASGLSLQAGVDVLGRMEATITSDLTEAELTQVERVLELLTERLGTPGAT